MVDSKGNAVSNAKVVIENTVFYASYIYATTNTYGYYKASVPSGSWKASVRIENNLIDETYNFDLAPDNADPFSGTEAAIRNFTLKLSGPRPEGGYYGGYVTVYTEPGSEFNASDVEVTLIPDGALIDGSEGSIIKKRTVDIGGGEDGIADVPLGQYKITARNVLTDQPLEIRLRNNGNYAPALTSIFKSGFTGVSTYQIVLQVK